MTLLYLFSLGCSIWLVSDNDPGSFWFVWGVVFVVINAVGLIQTNS